MSLGARTAHAAQPLPSPAGPLSADAAASGDLAPAHITSASLCTTRCACFAQPIGAHSVRSPSHAYIVLYNEPLLCMRLALMDAGQLGTFQIAAWQATEFLLRDTGQRTAKHQER